MRRVLVTGASGFVGRHVVPCLAEAGFEVVALDRTTSTGLRSFQQLEADLLVPASLTGLPREWDAIIHLAGDTVPRACDDGRAALRNPTMLINLCAHTSADTLIVASSAHVYASSNEPHSEDECLRPAGWYGVSKLLVEDVAAFYRSSARVHVTRGFNQIGPGMMADLLLPTVLRKLDALAKIDSTAPLELHGLDAVRDFIDVRDAAQGYLALLVPRDAQSATVNLCSGTGRSVGDLAAAIIRARGETRDVVFAGRPGSGDDVPCLVGSPGRMHALTGWRAQFTLAESAQYIVSAVGG